ncbi:hypothetical protein Bca52824_045473 [Brassica carinata]|uniref:Uncharacterized protein n=1 Tax=Brassica carinata TaxID=52824 RepID=A0A8X7UPB9_BRACI|nr:hypothetical protein Bca52824_045473 [Brassica carinata]
MGEDAHGKLIEGVKGDGSEGCGVRLDYVKLVTEEPTGHTVIVRNVGVVLLQREIPDSINIHVVKVRIKFVTLFDYNLDLTQRMQPQVVKRAVVSVILTWEEWICQSLMKYWIQSTSCTQMKLSSVASPEDLLKLLNILAKSSQSVISWYLTESMVKPSSVAEAGNNFIGGTNRGLSKSMGANWPPSYYMWLRH